MPSQSMTSLQRVLTTLGHQEPDRVPLILLVTMHGAKELGLSLREYYQKAENIAYAQLRMRAKFRHDCLYSFFYASIETEAFGGESIFIEDGPANAGEPIIHRPEDIVSLQPPSIQDSPGLMKVLEATRLMKAQIGAEAPIIGVVMSPFSLPVMQMGFDNYLNLMYERPDLFQRLMQVNEEFCVAWANAQLAAGATAICYFDPISSNTIVSREQYLATGWKIARRTLARIQGPTATHFASGRCLPIIQDVIQTGTAIMGVSADENLVDLKNKARNQVSLLGNLNGIEMRRWTPEHAEIMVKQAISRAGRGGGFLLGDNHGEIPFQVPEDILLAISEAVQTWGRYPLLPELTEN